MADASRRQNSSAATFDASRPSSTKMRGQLKKEPEEEIDTAHKGPTILAAEVFTHGGVRKAKFAPKVPARRLKKPGTVKSEPGEVGEAELSSELMKLVKQSQDDATARAARRTDIRAPVRVAFGFGSAMGGRAAAGSHKGGVAGSGGGKAGSGGGKDKKSSIKTLQSGLQDGMILDEKGKKLKEMATEPWDLSKYYPMTLPLRKPFSGRAEQLDEVEFGEASSRELDENAVPAAEELQLMSESDEDRLLFFQIPSLLPLSKEPAGGLARGSESSSSSRPDNDGAAVRLDKIPAGRMGKLLVYSSGAVKLQLGDVVLEAVAGSECVFAQELAAVNPGSKHCCFLGDVNQRIVLVPSMDAFLNSSSEEFG